jgi:hypothetical protein
VNQVLCRPGGPETASTLLLKQRRAALPPLAPSRGYTRRRNHRAY